MASSDAELTNEQITLEEALELVEFKQAADGSWFVRNVFGCVCGDVGSDVGGNVGGYLWGTISGKKWQFIETPKERLHRLIENGAGKEQLLEALHQMEDNQ